MSDNHKLLLNFQTHHKHAIHCLKCTVVALWIILWAAVPGSTFSSLTGSPPLAPNPTKHIISRDVTVIDGNESDSTIRPGDWLLVRSGERESLTLRNLKGEPGAPIVVVNYGGQVAIRTAGGVGIAIENCQHIRLTGTGYAGIEYGFDIKGFKNAGLFAQQGTEYIEIDHLEIHHPGDNLAAGMRVHSTIDQVGKAWVQHDTYIHHCYVHDVGSSAMYIGKHDGQDGTLLQGIEIAYNRAERCGTDAYQIRNAGQDCRVHHNFAQDIGLRVKGTVQGGSGLIIGPETGGLWHDNVVINADRGIQLLDHLSGVAIYRNLLVHCGYVRNEGGIRWFTHNAAIIHHNTIVGSKVYGIEVTEGITQGVIRDNFIVRSGEAHISAEVSTNNNVTIRSVRQARFVAPWEGDYHLLWGSPARLAGSDGRDVGAFPYQGEHVLPPSIERTDR